MATLRGSNMRDMKARQMSRLGALPPRPGSAPRGRPRKDAPVRKPGLERGLPQGSVPRPDDDDDAAELVDELDAAVHEARADGHFAPSSRRFVPDDAERDCPDTPPPGWEDD